MDGSEAFFVYGRFSVVTFNLVTTRGLNQWFGNNWQTSGYLQNELRLIVEDFFKVVVNYWASENLWYNCKS